MSAYYNEWDPFCARWLRNLADADVIPQGVVDETDVWDVVPADVMEYTQCHFFAGVGGWPIGLRLAGWPDDLPVWTGSPPCQPFSQAGKGEGFADERHLWPALFWLVEQVRPPVLLCEQVASLQGLAWLDVVSSDLERAGYTVWAVSVCAAAVGAPHPRQRLFVAARLADGHAPGRTHPEGGDGPAGSARRTVLGPPVWVGDPDGHRREAGSSSAPSVGPGHPPLPTSWDEYEWLPCLDGKYRPVEPGVRPLAYGLSAPSPVIGPYGNAVVPQVVAEFARAVLTWLSDD